MLGQSVGQYKSPNRIKTFIAKKSLYSGRAVLDIPCYYTLAGKRAPCNMRSRPLRAQVLTRWTWNAFIPAVLLLRSAVTMPAQQAEPIVHPGVRPGGTTPLSEVTPIAVVLPAQTPSFSLSGQWVDSFNLTWKLSEDNSGKILGTVTGNCPPSLWVATGDAGGKAFALVAHNPDSNNGCVGFQYRMTFSGSSTAQGTWVNLDGNGSGSVSMSKTCAVATGEITAFDRWDTDPTLGRWKQTLTSSEGLNFSGQTVQESNAGSGIDGCWFKGSAFAPFNTITGSTWTVNADNTWGDDFVGWLSTAVIYYRAHGRAPCGTSFLQQMTMKCTDGSFLKYGPINTLKGSMTGTTVTSGRAGGTATRRW
jgi:hypothetical protein